MTPQALWQNDSDFKDQRSATVAMAQPQRILSRLVKHFQHKVTAEQQGHLALIIFAEGVCYLQANESSLWMRCEANGQEDLLAITDTMDRHLAGFLQNDSLNIQWQAAD